MSIPDFSIEAEQSALGAMLHNYGACDGAQEVLTDYFTQVHHQAIASAIKAVAATDEDVDIFSVHEALQDRGHEVSQGYLVELSESVGSTLSFPAYVKRLKACWTRRSVKQSAFNVSNMADEIVDEDELINAAQSAFSDFEGTSGYKVITANEATKQYAEVLDKRWNAVDGITGIPSGIAEIDELTGGWIPGLHVIGARPKVGKTMMALNLMENALLAGYPALKATLEMPVVQLIDRMVSARSGAPLSLVKRPASITNSSMIEDIASAVTVISEWPIEFIDRSNTGIDSLCSSIRAWRRRQGRPGMVIIDYLQLITLVTKERHDLSIGDATRKLKNLSGEIECPIFLLSQLNRGVEQRPNKRPMASDTRDSGSIEQDADSIILLYRDEVYNENTQDKGIMEIIFAAARHHEATTIKVSAQMNTQRIRSLATNYYGTGQ